MRQFVLPSIVGQSEQESDSVKLHRVEPSSSDNSSAIEPPSSKRKKESAIRYACRVSSSCTKRYESPQARLTHERSEHADAMKKCNECSQCFFTSEELEKHSTSKHGIRVQCPRCESKLAKPVSFML